MNADRKGSGPIRFAFIGVHWGLIFSAVFAITLMVAPGKLAAQASDPAPLIDALAKQGMGELLEHLMQTEPPDDPVVIRQAKAAQYRLTYIRLSKQADRSAAAGDAVESEVLRAKALSAFDQMLDAARGLIADFPDHDQRPIWQTNLAQTLLIDYLLGVHQSATLFEEFGVTTLKQREAIAQAAPEALALLADADRRLFQLQGEIGRDPKRAQRLQSTGLYFRLLDEYGKRRTPYFLAQAAYMVARLPDDSSYFAGLGTPAGTKLPGQKDTPQRERARLLDLAYKQLEAFTGNLSDLSGVRPASLSLRARVLLLQGRTDQALEALNELISAGETGLAGLTAGFGRAATLGRMGRPQQALEELARLRRSPMVHEDLRYALLVTDMTHRVMLAQARQLPPGGRDRAVASSYQPYLDLLAGPIPGDRAQGLRDYIYRRWASSLSEDTGLDALPEVVRLAVSQVMRQQGQRLAQRIDSDGSASTAGAGVGLSGSDDLRRQADEKLNAAIRLARTLIGKSVEPAIRSDAMFNLAMAMYWLSPRDTDNRIELTTILTDLAEQMSAQPIAEDAITLAVSLLRELHQVLPTPAKVEQAYRRAAGVLFDKFPAIDAADGERLYYGYTVLESAGRYREAVAMYGRVPFDHDDYFRAQSRSLGCFYELYLLTQPVDRPRVRRELSSAIKRVTGEADKIRGSLVNPDRAHSARRAVGRARLITADLAMGDRDYDVVIKVLARFEQSYPDEPDLIAQVLRRRIVALGDAGRRDELALAAKQMTRDYPDQAASVIDAVLEQAEERIERLRSQAVTADILARPKLLDEATAQAQTAAVLSGLLLTWANTQGLNAQQLLPFQLIRAKTLRLSGETDPAIDILSKLIQAFPNDAQVMLEYAQVLYDRGNEASLIEAVRYFDRLITGLDPPYPQEWWVAWMRRLQINDRLNQGTVEIPLRVRQLRMTDPNLGSPVTRQELERLEHKHSR